MACFATRARHGQLADLELAHRRRARCEDRIRCAKDTGLRALPLHGLAQNQAWCELAALAGEHTARAQMLALHDTPARRWEPRRLRFRLFTTAGRWRLAEMRKRRGMTQEQVATRMGISIARVSQIESGDVSTQDVLNRFITALGGTLKLIADFGDEQLKIA
jgi:DNA-binding XRE family transcriptional regulator